LDGLQGFVVCVLLVARFSPAFFFCLGFLASRLDRFCSLFATTLSLLHKLRRNMPRIGTESTKEFAGLR
jgi:hypothetical protein